MFIFSTKMIPFLRVSTHIYGVFKNMGGKTFIFQIKLGMWHLKSIILEKWSLSEGFNTHLWGFWGDRWGNVHFESKPRHVTPQIEHLGKMHPVLRVSTHIYGVSKDIGGKTFIFWLNLVYLLVFHFLYKKWKSSVKQEQNLKQAQIFRFTWVRLTIDPQIETDRGKSKLFAVQIYPGKTDDWPPNQKLTEGRANSLQFNDTNDSPFKMVN